MNPYPFVTEAELARAYAEEDARVAEVAARDRELEQREMRELHGD